jgi:predicted PurR-regulated permease PerM
MEEMHTPTKPERFSYYFVAGALLLMGLLHLGGLVVTVLFSYFALEKLNLIKPKVKWPALVLFAVLFAGLLYGLGFLVKQMVLTLPHIAEKAIPLVLQWAQQHHIELPFSDYDSLKEVAMDTVKGQAQGLARFARGASSEMIRCVVAVVIAAGVFLNPHFQTAGDKTASPNSVYTVSCEAIAERIRTFYGSFATVMGAQIVISAVNTVLTACFVLAVQLPYGFVVVGATFICGLLPIIGNLISNTIIVGIGITVSPKMAIAALVFLVIVHKLEYFLNSKIVGDRIRNPFWMTLLALILGERLLGIPGMILAPVVLNYVRVEASRVSSGATQL